MVRCVYPAREHADQLVALLRDHGTSVVAAPSDHYAGEWDVPVPAHDVSRAAMIVRELLSLD